VFIQGLLGSIGAQITVLCNGCLPVSESVVPEAGLLGGANIGLGDCSGPLVHSMGRWTDVFTSTVGANTQ
jgi:hypothetical protein